ncbi:hypothetical protein BV898_17644 [Hypsibius exemplaris]|uniref:Uncharacterized protein n=1 Tax=Hypsibius exemplaris TaxID=2072580 RepID=A0A9X6RMZ9_HYPEX|nr:hypothetical protein BV898_17644 [Hypsibius exemplaris]
MTEIHGQIVTGCSGRKMLEEIVEVCEFNPILFQEWRRIISRDICVACCVYSAYQYLKDNGILSSLRSANNDETLDRVVLERKTQGLDAHALLKLVREMEAELKETHSRLQSIARFRPCEDSQHLFCDLANGMTRCNHIGGEFNGIYPHFPKRLKY